MDSRFVSKNKKTRMNHHNTYSKLCASMSRPTMDSSSLAASQLLSSSSPILYKRTADEIACTITDCSIIDCDAIDTTHHVDTTASVKRQRCSTSVSVHASTNDVHELDSPYGVDGPVLTAECLNFCLGNKGKTVKCTMATAASDDHWQHSSISAPMHFYVSKRGNDYTVDVVVTVHYINVHSGQPGSYMTGIVCLHKDEQGRVTFDESHFRKKSEFVPLYLFDLTRFATVYLPVACKLYDEHTTL